MEIGLNIYDLTEDVRQVIIDTAGMTIASHLESALPLEIKRDADDRLLPDDIEDGTRVTIHQAHNDAVMFLTYDQDLDLREGEDPPWRLFWGEAGSARPTQFDDDMPVFSSDDALEIIARLDDVERRLDRIDQLFSKDKVMSVLADLLAKAKAFKVDEYR